MRPAHLLRAFLVCAASTTAGAAVAQAPAPAPAAAPAAPSTLSAVQRAEMEGVVRGYLMTHPEVIKEALIELQRKEKAEEAAARVRVVSDPNSKLFTSPHQAVVGNPNGKVTIVEFFDYNCGFCKRALDDLAKLMKSEPELKVVLKDFPVLGPKSLEAAQVAIAARKQLKGDKYFEFHQKLLNTKGPIGRAEGVAVAKAMGLDMAKLATDLEDPSVREAIGETLTLGDSLGMTGTPSYVVGKEVVIGAVGYDELKQHLDAAQKK
jgi:protein-disulfide isomerase